MADQRPWIALDSAVLPLTIGVSHTEAGFIGEVLDHQGQLVWASEPQPDEAEAERVATSQKDAYAGIRRVREHRFRTKGY